MTLTDKWKKGEFPDDEYYCRTTHDSSVRRHYLSNIDNENMIEILAPVPSYDEYLEMEGHCAAYSDINQWQKEEISAYGRLVAELKQENTKLKELLKECKHIMSIEKDFASCHFEKDKLCNLLNKINQVLGEE